MFHHTVFLFTICKIMLKRSGMALLTVLLSATAFAQKIELGLNAGIAQTGSKSNNTSLISPKGSISAAYNISKSLQAGITAGYYAIHTRDYSTQKYEWTPTGLIIHQSPGSISINTYNIRVFVNVRQAIGRFTCYAGISGGFASPVFPYEKDMRQGLPKTGHVFALQTGVNYSVSKRVYVNAEVGIDRMILGARPYIDYNEDAEQTHLIRWAIPATLGLRVVL